MYLDQGVCVSICVYLCKTVYVPLPMYFNLGFSDLEKGLAVVLNPFNKPLSPKINLHYDS